ncbi:hypothetical protein MJH12_16995, partial [bacterium]|nr:hypothetical protein [bacterium]
INRISALLSMYTRFYPGARIQIREDVMIVAWNKEFKKKEIEGFHPYPEMSVFSFLDKIKSRSMVYRYELMEHFIQEDRAKAKNSLDLSQWKSILKSSLHFYEMGYFSLALDLSNQLLEIDSLNEEYRYFNLLLKHQQQTHHYEKFYKQWLEEDEPSLPQDTTESILRKLFQTRYMWDWYNMGDHKISSRLDPLNYWFDLLLKIHNEDLEGALKDFERAKISSFSRLHQKIVKTAYEHQGKTKDAIFYED